MLVTNNYAFIKFLELITAFTVFMKLVWVRNIIIVLLCNFYL